MTPDLTARKPKSNKDLLRELGAQSTISDLAYQDRSPGKLLFALQKALQESSTRIELRAVSAQSSLILNSEVWPNGRRNTEDICGIL